MSSDAPRETTSRAEWLRGWTLVLSAAAGMGLASVHVYSAGLFIIPLELEFGWARAEITLGLLAPAIIGAVFSPFVGMLIDRFGARRIAIPGSIIYCTAIGCLSLASSSIWMWWGTWVLLGIGSVMIKPTVWSAAISASFRSARGLALAVMMCGAGVSAFISPNLANFLIERFGWRIGFLGVSAFWAVLVIPLLIVFFRYARASRPVPPLTAGTVLPKTPEISLGQEIWSPAFRNLFLIALIFTPIISGLSVHMSPLLIDLGFTSAHAAAGAGLIGVSSILGRIVSGILLDKIAGYVVGSINVLLPAGTILLISLFPHSGVAIVIGICLFGFAVGGELDCLIYLVSRCFSEHRFGTIFGLIMSVISLGIGVGPYLFSLVHDTTGSYQLALSTIIPLCLISSLLFVGLRSARLN